MIRGGLDLSSWQSVLGTIAGIALIALVGVGIRLIAMLTIQQRRERLNRQINERLKTLIAAYKVLGGSFTGDLTVDPSHLRDLRARGEEGSDRTRRIRDAVEAALSDVILLGTPEQVRLATAAAHELVAGRTVHVDRLVASLRAFIREALDLDPVPADLVLPRQGPARPAAGARANAGGRERGGGAGGGGGMMAGGDGVVHAGARDLDGAG